MNGVFWIAFGQCGFDSNFIVGDYNPKSQNDVDTIQDWVDSLIGKAE